MITDTTPPALPDALDAAVWFADDDGDLFGDAAASTTACEAPSGFVGDDNDCDDSRAAVNPDADELCDELDNDCDGEIDPPSAVDAQTWYGDGDGDGVGVTRLAVRACVAPRPPNAPAQGAVHLVDLARHLHDVAGVAPRTGAGRVRRHISLPVLASSATIWPKPDVTNNVPES